MYWWMWKTEVNLKDYNNYTFTDVFKFELQQVRHFLNSEHLKVVTDWILNDDYFILKFVLYNDLFFWLLNCFLNNNKKYRFMTYLTRTFQMNTQNNNIN